eukprot:8059301-Lingulodinium_polyedra.AAC.1
MTFPPQDKQDLKFKCIEERMRGTPSAQAIMDALPDVHKMAVPDIWHKCMPGVYAFKPGKWEALPEM